MCSTSVCSLVVSSTFSLGFDRAFVISLTVFRLHFILFLFYFVLFYYYYFFLFFSLAVQRQLIFGDLIVCATMAFFFLLVVRSSVILAFYHVSTLVWPLFVGRFVIFMFNLVSVLAYAN